MKDYVHFHDYDSFVSNIDLLTDADGPMLPNGDPRGVHARRILVLNEGGGTLSVRLANGNTETVTILAGDIGTRNADFEVTVIGILSATDVGKLRVFW